MMTIYKYPIKITGVQVIRFQKGYELLSVGLDPNNIPCIWAKVDPSQEVFDEVEIYVVGTGNPCPDMGAFFIGTFKQHPFMWHVFTS